LQHLNHSYPIPNLPFHALADTIHVDNTDIDFLFAHSVIDTINKIFSKHLYFAEGLPLIAFDRKPPALFVYDAIEKDKEKNNTTNTPIQYEWKMFPREKISQLLCKIQWKISKQMTEWKNQASTNDFSEFKRTTLYDKTYSKLMAPDFKNETTRRNYFKLLFNNLKKSMITELEIDFNC
jgi:hypothetical protein